jgi:SynChlorMet cassette protein ScmD
MKKSNPIANPLVVLREEFDDWAVLFNPDTAEAVGTNPVGVFVWRLMDGSRSIEEIVDEIKTTFEAVPKTTIDDIQGFIYNLFDKGFVGYELETDSQ